MVINRPSYECGGFLSGLTKKFKCDINKTTIDTSPLTLTLSLWREEKGEGILEIGTMPP